MFRTDSIFAILPVSGYQIQVWGCTAGNGLQRFTLGDYRFAYMQPGKTSLHKEFTYEGK